MRKNIIALVIFIFLSGIMTYPIVLKMKSHLPGHPTDALHQTWVLAWDIHKFCTGISGYWDTNIFYPYNLTLTFSEHLTGIAIFGLPVMLLTNNIIFTFDLLFLLSFVLSGFGIYLLVKHLTGNFYAGIISGIIFAFAPLRFAHLPRLQLLTTQWLPFAFLYLHKFFGKNNFKYLVLFALFYVLQCLSSLNISLFMTVFVLLFLVYYLSQKKIKDAKVFAKIGITFILISIVLLPFIYPYVKAKMHYGFYRDIAVVKFFSTHLESYFLNIPPINHIYGKLTNKFWDCPMKASHEKTLFFGLTPLLLIIGAFWLRKKKIVFTIHAGRRLLLIWDILVFLNILTMVVFVFTGGNSVYLFDKEIHSYYGVRSFEILVLLTIIRLYFDKFWRQKITDIIKSIELNERFYFLMVAVAIFLSFGPVVHFFRESFLPGPYLIFYYLVPGFKGVRVPARFGFMTLFGISVLTGYGYNILSTKVNSITKKSILGIFLIILLLIEYCSIPIPAVPVKTPKDIPPVYKWLARQKGDFPIVELTLQPDYSYDCGPIELFYMYYSTYHWKKLLNGHSSYISPIFLFIRTQSNKFPSVTFFNLLKKLGIKYMIIHAQEYEKLAWGLNRELNKYKDDVSFVGKFESDFIYEIKDSSFSLTKPEEPNQELFIPKERWQAESNSNNKNIHYAIDDKLKTFWHTDGPRQPGMYFELDLGKIYEFNRIWLSLGNHCEEYPENFKLEVSKDNKNWEVIVSERNISPELFLTELYFSPKNPKIDIQFDTQKARYIKITQQGTHKFFKWIIHEIEVQRDL